MSGLCDGRVVIVTGAGRGLGREHALEFARQGAKVVVNDIGATLDGQGRSATPAQQVVEEIRDEGGVAVLNDDDVADWNGAQRLINGAIEEFGRLDTLVNNAGVLRDRLFSTVTEEEWETVVRVHLHGHFCAARHAAAYWRAESKSGNHTDGRIINTTSGAGLLGSVGQAAYSAAKAGIVGLTLVQAAELARYGVTANAIAPAARTRMTEEVFRDLMAPPADGSFDTMAPGNVSPMVVWLGSAESRDVTGRVFEVGGGRIGVAQGWTHGPSIDETNRSDPATLGPAVRRLLDDAEAPLPVYGATFSVP